MIPTLDVKLRTPTPVEPLLATANPWVLKKLQNPIEATSQSEFIKDQIARHQNSTPTLIYSAIDQFVKSTQSAMHSYAILKDRVATLEEANRILSKRRREKRKRVHHGGSLRIQDAQNLIDEKDAETQVLEETRAASGRRPVRRRANGEIFNVHTSQ